jgi:hypothetical protein
LIHTIKCSQAGIRIEPSNVKEGHVMITLTPKIWPPVYMHVLPHEAALIGEAMALSAKECAQ